MTVESPRTYRSLGHAQPHGEVGGGGPLGELGTLGGRHRKDRIDPEIGMLAGLAQRIVERGMQFGGGTIRLEHGELGAGGRELEPHPVEGGIEERLRYFHVAIPSHATDKPHP